MRKKLQAVSSYLISIVQLDRSVLLYLFAWSMIGFVHLGINAVLLNLFLKEIGFDLGFIARLSGIGLAAWALAAFPAGALGQRFGLRNTLIAGYGIVSLGLCAFLFVIWLPRPLWEAWLIVTNVIVWVAAAPVVVCGTPYLMGITPEKDRSKAFTLMSALLALTAFTGSIFAGNLPGFLIKLFPTALNLGGAYNAVMWISAPGYLLSGLLLLKARKEPAVEQVTGSTRKDGAPVGILVFLGALFGLQVGSENALGVLLNVYFSSELRVSDQVIGTVFATARLMPFFISPLQPLALNRWGSGRTMAFGYLIVAGSSLLVALISTGAAAVAGFILFSLAVSFTATARNIYGQEAVQPQWRSTVSALTTVATALSGTVVGFSAGRIIETAGFRGLFLASTVLALLSVFLYTGGLRIGAARSSTHLDPV
jgi:MFS family permease